MRTVGKVFTAKVGELNLLIPGICDVELNAELTGLFVMLFILLCVISLNPVFCLDMAGFLLS